MKKSIFLFFAAILCAMSVQGATAELKNGQYLYCTVNNSNWKTWSIMFNWYWNEGDWCCQDKGTKLATDIWYANIPNDYTRAVQLIRCQTDFSEQWNWSKTVKASSRSNDNQNCVNITGSAWGDAAVSWTTYAPPMSSVTLSDNGTTVNSGSGTEADPYIIEIGTTIKVKAEGTKAVEDPDATINYDFKQGSTSKQNGTGTTWTLTASDASTVYTINLDGYTKVNTTSSTKTAATALYFKTVADVSIPTYQVSVSINDNTMGSVIGAGEYNENATVTLKATANDGYRFVNWTVGGVEKETATTYSFTVTEAVEVVANFKEIPTETVYLVNNSDWTKVYAYGWKDGEAQGTPAWPGTEITVNKLAEKYEGYDVYSYKVEENSYDNVIFNNNSGKQTATFDWENGKYYYAVDPLGSNVFLAGDMNSWSERADELKKETAESTTASIKVNLTAKTYKFKLVIDGAWKGNSGTMKRGGDAVHEGGWSFDEDGGDDKNCKLVADFAGDYTFTWDLTTKKLTVTYPELPTYTVTATAENGTVTGAGEYQHGTEATLVATPNTGYAFVNWKKGEEVVSSEASYTFTVTANTDLVATFAPEETHEVTVSYLCNSNPIPGHDAITLAVGVTTPSTITAPAITNYKFDSWTVGTGVQAVDETANPIQITTLAEGGYTLVANYTKIELTYTVKVPGGTEKCYIAGDMNSWSFQEMTPTANANEFTITIDGATTDHKYKYACGPDWAYVEKKADGSDLDADRTYNANDVVAKWAEPAKCYLMGNGDWVNGVEMEEDGDQFKLLCHHISAPFKFKYGETWSDAVENYDFPGIAWVDGNIVLPEGDYDFYYKKNENKVWIGVCTPATPTPDYTRATTAGNFGTICLPFGGEINGAELYQVAGKEAGKVFLDEATALEAGVPYIFLATATELAVYSDGTTATASNKNGLYGTFDDNTSVAEGMYIVYNNELRLCGTGCVINANRAYLNLSEVTTNVPAPMPGRRRVAMGVTGENQTTGFENITAPEGKATKVLRNGQIIIIRNGQMYNAQGQKL